jgi:glucose/arabinose dehydrogenase
MELGAFTDPDGDEHQATDWVILDPDDGAVVWAALGSPVLTHAHLPDGAFRGPLAGARRLEPVTTYELRVRFQDGRGAWSDWSERYFLTSAQMLSPLRRATGLLPRPAPRWLTEGGRAMALPAGAEARLLAGETPLLRLERQGDAVVAVSGEARAEPAPLRLTVSAAPDAALDLPASRLVVVTDRPERLTLFLPALRLVAGESATLWATETGATLPDLPDGAGPDRERVARDVDVPWALPPGYQAEAVAAALRLPTSLAFVAEPEPDPDAPRLYVSELHGRVMLITNAGEVRVFADNLLGFTPEARFPGQGEMGVVGVCLPPAGRDVYATMVYRDQAGTLRNKVVRLRSPDGRRVAAVEDVLVSEAGTGVASYSHQIQQCSFGPDGKLYVFVGDGNHSALAQDDRAFNGKVLRLNPDGSAPVDNPFYDPAAPTAPRSYQWTKGHRNAFGMAWRPADGRLYLAENGPDVDRLVQIAPGLNYGWDGTNDSMRAHALYNWPEPHWSPVGLAFADGATAAGLGPERRGRLFVGAAGPVYARGRQQAGKAIQAFAPAADGAIPAEPTVFARYVGEGQRSVADVKTRPDGLYFTDLYEETGDDGPAAPGGAVWRIRHVGVADFEATPTGVPGEVRFADRSTLRDAAARRWDFGDGAGSGEAAPTHAFPGPGRYAVELALTDAAGRLHERVAFVIVPGDPGVVPTPEVAVAAPEPPASVFFPATGARLGGAFLDFWEAQGGLARFGQPIGAERVEADPATGRPRVVQYFERARFERAADGGDPAVRLGLLGRETVVGATDEEPFQAHDEPLELPDGARYFAETGQSASGPFLAYWEATGGLAVHGLPISEPFVEAPLPGAPARLVQYFERARLEQAPAKGEAPGPIRAGPVGLQAGGLFR